MQRDGIAALAGFLSTPSARRATFVVLLPVLGMKISIHALCEEGDPRRKSRSNPWSIFLSTPSARRATWKALCWSRPILISIHALCEEGDVDLPQQKTPLDDFYPRPLRGGRRGRIARESSSTVFLSTPSARRATSPMQSMCQLSIFLSTPSARRATSPVHSPAGNNPISIHALCEEGDSKNRDKISIFKQIIQHSARI